MLFLFYLPCFFTSLLDTLSGSDIEISKSCMVSRNPCLPNTYDCSQNFYAVSVNLQSSIKELLTALDSSYSLWSGTIKTVAGVQGGLLIARASSNKLSVQNPDSSRYYNYVSSTASSLSNALPGWTAGSSIVGQYLSFGSSVPYQYEELSISGHAKNDNTQFIKSFNIYYTLDGINWTGYKDGLSIATGLSASINLANIVLTPFIARSVKINFLTWAVSVGCTVEWYISKPVYSNVLPFNSLIAAVKSGFHVAAFSSFDAESNEFKLGTDIKSYNAYSNSWCSANLQNEWVVVSSAVPVRWEKITTYGGFTSRSNYVSSYYIMYSTDVINWLSYQDNYTFTGNTDSISAVTNIFTPFVAYAVRFHPVTYTNSICARVEVYCTEI